MNRERGELYQSFLQFPLRLCTLKLLNRTVVCLASRRGASPNKLASQTTLTQTSYFMTDAQSGNDRRTQALDKAVQRPKKSQSECFHISNGQIVQKGASIPENVPHV